MPILSKMLTGIFIIAFMSTCSQKTYNLNSDQVGKRPLIRDGVDELKFVDDHYVYTFNSKYIAVADGQKTYPKHFTINLPANLRYYQLADMHSFAFCFKNQQCLFVYIDQRQQINKDTSYIPDEKTVNDLIFRKLSGTWDPTTNNMNSNPLRRDRRTLLIEKGVVTLLLFNIREKEYLNILNNGFRLIN